MLARTQDDSFTFVFSMRAGSNAFLSTFDILMNSFEVTDARGNHLPVASAVFYVVINLAFLLIMGQFIIAILCGSFDETREAQSEQEERDKPPTGYVLIEPTWCSWSHFVMQLVQWDFHIAEMPAKDLLAMIDVGGPSPILTPQTLSKCKCRCSPLDSFGR